MPHKSEKAPLGQYDRRKKLNDVQRAEILELRRVGLSYQVIADRYNVSKRLIIFVCNPDIAERNRIASMERHREGRYTPTKDEWAATMREHRAYKKELYEKGLIG